MNKKRCTRCKKVKDYSEFYTNKRTRDGRVSQCKACHLSLYKDGRDRYNKSQKGIELAKEYKKSESGKVNRKLYLKKNPQKYNARNAVSNAVSTGKILPAKKCKCADCGKSAKEYHHPDYSKPLSVVPLCKKCHRKRHGKS